MEERISTSELIGSAVNARSLSPHGQATSVLGAMAFTHADLGFLLHRLKAAAQPAVWPEALAAFTNKVKGLSVRHRWKADAAQVAALCPVLLRQWLFDVCAACMGRGKDAIELDNPGGTKTESVCGTCGGSGKSKRDWRERADALKVTPGEFQRRWEERCKDADGVLEWEWDKAQRGVAKRLAKKTG